MIVTKSWLNEWVDISDKSVDELCLVLNQIGLEVDSAQSFNMPENIVIGFVLSCEPHPDAEKLNVCKVDVGTGVRQIVCGASNVREGIFVPVAMIGAVMPGGLEIKPVKLRGVESDGMICSSSELGLPKLCEGILILDDSIGELKAGKALSEYDVLNDAVIEIELTANRGDCLSQKGVARDLAAAFGRSLKKNELKDSDYRRTGAGRVMHLVRQNDINADVVYKSFHYEGFEIPLKYRYRLTLVDESYEHELDAMVLYSTLSTGVLLRAYNHEFFTKDDAVLAEIILTEDDKEIASIVGTKEASRIGMMQNEISKVTKPDTQVIIEASYIEPDLISRQVYEHKIKTDALYYRSSRGTDPEIALGIQYCADLLMRFCKVEFTPGTFEYLREYIPQALNLNICSMNALIGDNIEKVQIVKILNALGFEIIKSQDDNIIVHPPRFRHDIHNEQDVVEEVVRMVGIDHIQAKPLSFVEKDVFNASYRSHQRKRDLRQKAAAVGFFETVSYLFSERTTVESFGYKACLKKLELLNPIVDTMDTLRPTMHIAHIESASRNIKMGQKSVPLFEYGTIFDPQRDEKTVLSFLFSGDKEGAKVSNAGHALSVDFEYFVQKIADVIGHFDLTQSEATHAIMHPYQCADIMVGQEACGKLFKLHTQVAQQFDLPDTFLAEIDVEKLDRTRIQAQPYSKYQSLRRDLSIVVPKDFVYDEIRKLLEKLDIAELNSVEMIDIYSDENLKDQVSLTLRFIIQSFEKTLNDKDISAIMKQIMDLLTTDLGFTLR